MFLSICPSCHHRDEQTESGEFPRGAVTCNDCGAPYAPIHAADVRFGLLRDWATREGVEFDDESPIEEEEDAKRFEAFLANGAWFVKAYSREVMSGPEQFEFTCVDQRWDPESALMKAMFGDANDIRSHSKGVGSTSVENDGPAYRLTTAFLHPKASQTDTYYLIKGF